MKRATVENVFARIFGNRSDTAIEALSRSQPVQDLLDGIDSDQVDRRRALIAELEELPRLHEPACAAANQELEKAKLALQKALNEVKAANDVQAEAYSRSFAASCLYERAKTRRIKELEETADPRIERFITACLDLTRNEARHAAPKAWVTYGASEHSRSRVHFDASNVQAALDALLLATKRARDLKLQALTHREITAHLERFAADLEQPLAGVDIKHLLPKIDADEVGVTMH